MDSDQQKNSSSSTLFELTTGFRDIERAGESSSDPLLESTKENLMSKGVDQIEQDFSNFISRSSANGYSALYPPNSMAVQPGGYDPNRIPSSIFNSKPATPMEWSVASNESLFSIHMGNNSLSKELAFPIFKSGEFPETTNSSLTLSPVVEKPSGDISKESKLTEAKLPEPAKVEPGLLPVKKKAVPEENEPAKNVSHEKIPPPEEVRDSCSSTQSFHFPVLDSNVEGNTSVKVMMESMPSKKQLRQESQEPIKDPETTKKEPGRSWFPCFSCCSLGCS